jgi:Icc-related predicted phosphoesterase
MKIVCISDTHSQNLLTKWDWPEGDVLVHAGDLTSKGHHEHIKKIGREMLQLPYRWRLVVAGNHDRAFWEASSKHYTSQAWSMLPGITVLEDEAITIRGVKFYGTSYFTFQRESELPKWEAMNYNLLWSGIPDDADIVITHIPPFGILDRCEDGSELGSETLRQEIIGRVKPIAHIFGHAHKDHGIVEYSGIKFVNASLVDNERNHPAYEPIVIEVDSYS